jgi:hypothetical protein
MSDKIVFTPGDMQCLRDIFGAEDAQTICDLVMTAQEQWRPVPDGFEYAAPMGQLYRIVACHGAFMVVGSKKCEVAIKLPDNIRLCILTDASTE